MKNVIIVGAGGFAREVYDWAKESLDEKKYQLIGFLSNRPNDLDDFAFDVGILGDDESYDIKTNDLFLFAIGNIDTKKRIVANLKKRGAKFMTLIHKTAVVSTSATIGEGVIICPFALVSNNAFIDDFAMLNFYSSCAHDSKIGKYSILSPYSTVNGSCTIEDEVFLGTHSTVTAHKTVGYRSKVNANSVVMYDASPYTFVLGVPGKNKIIFSK